MEEGAEEDGWGWGMEEVSAAGREPPCAQGAPLGAVRGQQYPALQAQVPTGPSSEVADERLKEGRRRRVERDAETSVSGDGLRWGLSGEQFHKSAGRLGSSVTGLIDLAGDDETHYRVLQVRQKSPNDRKRAQ